MKMIHQRHANGCVTACIAMVSNKSYNKLFKCIYGEKKYRCYPGLTLEHLLRALNKQNLKYKISFCKKDYMKLLSKNSNAIIVVDYDSKKTGLSYDDYTRHAVVWDGTSKLIKDPYPLKQKKIYVNEKYCFLNFSFLIEFE